MKLFAIVEENVKTVYGIYQAESPVQNAVYLVKDGQVLELAHCEVVGGVWVPDADFNISEDAQHYHTLTFI